jgi:hypothetical protein
VEWGPEIKVKSASNGVFSEMISYGPGGVFGFREKVGYAALFGELDWYIAHYNTDDLSLEEIHSLFPKDFFKKGKSQPTSLDGIYHFNDKQYVFYSNYQKKKFTSYVLELDNEYNVTGEPIELDEVDVEGSFSKGSYGIRLSQDSSKLLIYYLTPFKRMENEKFRFMIFDTHTIEKIAEKEIILPKKDKDFYISDMQLTPDNKVYLLAKEYYEKSEKKNKTYKDPKYYYTFYQYDLNGDDEETGEYKIELEKKFINDLAFEFVDDQIVVSGFYGLKNSQDISGIFYMRLNRLTGDTKAEDVYEFPKEFVAEFYTQKQVDKADKKGKDLEVPRMVFRSFIVEDDGSALLVAEQHYIIERCYTDSRGNVRCVYYYYYNDIIVTRVNADGEIEWCIKIPKKSVDTVGGYYLGYLMGETDDYLYFFFNDHLENANTNDPVKVKQLGSLKKSAVVMVTVDKKGNAEKEMLYSQEKSKQFFRPRVSAQFEGTKDMIFYTIGSVIGNGKERLGKFTLPK